MSKFKQYLEMAKGVKTEKYQAPNPAYKDLMSAIEDSIDNNDKNLFDSNALIDVLNDYNFTLDQNKKIATHSSGVKFNVDRIIKICKNNIGNIEHIDDSRLKPAEIK